MIRSKDSIDSSDVNMHGVSVIVCCHNSSGRLPATLIHLARQRVGPDIPWEVIIVDNASTDDTAEVAFRSWANDSPTILIVVREPHIGLSHARQRGFLEAKYEIVSFIDDDNWVCENWVQLVSEIMSQHPNIGACGGSNEAVCETSPPWWFDQYKQAYAVGVQGDEAGDVSCTKGYLWGAGLTVRKSAWQQLARGGFQQVLVDRKGKAQTTGGDAELTLALRLAGWQLWYEPRLQLRHFLPAVRLNWAYLLSLHRSIGASSVWLDFYSQALEGHPKNLIEWLKRTRGGKILFSLAKLVWYESRQFLSFCGSTEGSALVLQAEIRIGRLLELLQGRKVHDLSVRTKKRDIVFQKSSLS
jgi:glycosyltransferase involved in cell wall biosynthesis